MSAGSLTRTWTPDEVRALGVRTDLVTACEIAYGAKRTKAYELFRRGELDFPAVRVGNRVVVPVASICEFLGIPLEPAATSRSSLTGPAPPPGLRSVSGL